MLGTINKLFIDEHECLLYLPPDYYSATLHYPVVYVNGEDELQEIMDAMEQHYGEECEAFILVSVQCTNWNDHYTPWPAPALKKNDKPFGGKAKHYLEFLVEIVKPYIDANYRTKKKPEDTALIGYSLGGLTALYLLYTCGAFGKIGSLSGSLWFDGWVEFIDCNMPANTDAKVYLSLGTGEEHSRNQRMASVGECTRRTADILKQQLNSSDNLIFQWNNGGHFTDINKRYEKAILWLMRKDKGEV